MEGEDPGADTENTSVAVNACRVLEINKSHNQMTGKKQAKYI